jgi:hypothetical protein
MKTKTKNPVKKLNTGVVVTHKGEKIIKVESPYWKN